MPRSIKPHMSKDMLAPFSCDIESISFDQGFIDVLIRYNDYKYTEVSFDEKDLETMLQFLRRNK